MFTTVCAAALAGAEGDLAQPPGLCAATGILTVRNTSSSRVGAQQKEGHLLTSRVRPVFWGGLGRFTQFRIPVLLRVGAGNLLAFAEGRPSRRDYGEIRLVLRRSIDGGRSWQPLEQVQLNTSNAAFGEGRMTLSNPVPVYLPPSTLLLLFCTSPAHASESDIRSGRAKRHVWRTISHNLGRNFSTPVEISRQVMGTNFTWFATGPGGALRLADGTLLVPATYAELGVAGGRDHSTVLASYDGGLSWQRGSAADPGTNEATIARLPNGSLLLNARTTGRHGLANDRRTLQLSLEQGRGWSPAWYALRQPRNRPGFPKGCHGSMVAAAGRLWFVGPDAPVARANLTLAVSHDGGVHWSTYALLHEGPAGYSSLVVQPGERSLALLAETGIGKEHYATRILSAQVRLDCTRDGRMAPPSLEA